MLRLKTFIHLFKSSKELRLFFIIDFLFYFYCIFGFILVSKIGIAYNLKIVNAVVIWSLIFLPIIGLKMYKEIVKSKHKDLYD